MNALRLAGLGSALVLAGILTWAGGAAAQDATTQAAPPPGYGDPAGQPPPAYGQPAPVGAQPMVATPPPVQEEHPAPNSIYAEGLGAALLYSINYERLVIDQLAVRVGLAYWSVSASVTTSAGTDSASVSFLEFPITASYVGIRSGSHVLELGGGATLIYASGTASSLGISSSGSGIGAYGVAFAGYRLHPIHGGFMFRVGLMLGMGPGMSFSSTHDPNAFGVIPWGYISLGASF